MRDYTDYLYACDTTIADGILDGLRVLIVTMDGYYKTSTLKAIRAFVERGGLLIGINLDELRDLEEDADYLDILFGKDGKTLGAIGILGPRRMDYARVLATLEQLSGNISELINHNNVNGGLPDGGNEKDRG